MKRIAVSREGALGGTRKVTLTKWVSLLVGAVLLTAIVGCGAGAPPEDAPRATTGTPDARRVEAVSLLGRELFASTLSDDFRSEQEALLNQARAELDERPDDPDAIIWAGRRTAYLGRYREAIEIYTRGIEAHPEYAKLYRHRGHRGITLRQFDAAIADLERAAELIAETPDEIEPDGLPNARNIPTSTSHSNIWYHLGLAYYLKGDLENALRAYRECLEFSKNPDMLCATSHWLYMTLRRMGRESEARNVLEPIHAGMDIIENHDYHSLLLMYQGARDAEHQLAEIDREDSSLSFATTAYGVGNWHLYNGNRDRAMEIFNRIVDGDSWAAFGFIAAEAELARLGGSRRRS